MAAALDLRVPTGDETNLLGTGGVQTRVYGIGSIDHWPFAPHLNLGYTFSSEGALPDTRAARRNESRCGVRLVMTPRATLAVDFVGRTLLDAGQMRP